MTSSLAILLIAIAALAWTLWGLNIVGRDLEDY